jgi:hypothetical protein
MHPFLMLDEAWFAGVRQVLARLRALALGGQRRVLTGGRLAHALRLLERA